MSRLTDALLTGSYAAGKAPMLDLQYGGQMGYAPNLTEWVSHQSYIRKNLICLLIEAPKGFQYLPDPQFWVSALKALVETHAKTIDGLNDGRELEFAENAVGGGGEMQQDLTNVTRPRSEPSFTFVDKYGRPIQTFLQQWVDMLGMEPDSKVAGIATLAGNRPSDMLADMMTATMLFFEPDPTHSKVAKAWLTTNMMPKNMGEVVGKRDLTAAGEPSEITIPFTGISQTNVGVRMFAQSLLDKINFTNANPNMRPAFVQNIAADVAAVNGRGYKSQAEGLGATALRT